MGKLSSRLTNGRERLLLVSSVKLNERDKVERSALQGTRTAELSVRLRIRQRQEVLLEIDRECRVSPPQLLRGRTRLPIHLPILTMALFPRRTRCTLRYPSRLSGCRACLLTLLLSRMRNQHMHCIRWHLTVKLRRMLASMALFISKCLLALSELRLPS
jgi:hypothetical protein